MTAIRLAINGAAGRMGRRLVALASLDPDLKLLAALEQPTHPHLGQDAGQLAGVGEMRVPLVSELAEPVDVLIDFSVPDAAEAITALCVARRLPLVLATTGLNDAQRQRVHQAVATIPIVCAPNMSLAVNLAMKLAEQAARTFHETGSSVDVEIIDRHHRFKEDAPSGTALRFGELIAKVLGQQRHVHGRHGKHCKREPAEIGYHALRVGDNPGEHTIVFGLLGEMLEITVRATNRDCYALGALAAAKFVASRPPGLYGMSDVLGL